MRRIVKTALFFLLITLMLAALGGMAAASGNASKVTLNQVQQNGADLTMYVSMRDASGDPCTGDYGAEQFVVAVKDAEDDDNKDEGEIDLDVDSVEPFDPEKQGIHYVFCVDVSTSMIEATGDMMARVREGMNGFVDAMGPKDTVSILTFGERVIELLRNSGDRAQIKQTIDSLQATEDKTALYKGVIDGVSLASAGGRSAVVVITDGTNDPTDAMKEYTKESIYDQVEKAQTPLYCIGLNDGNRNGVDTQSLEELAGVTGGDQFVIRSESIPDTLSRVQATMRSAVVLHATLINPEGKTGFGKASKFVVGFSPKDGGFVYSNELQQVVNWKSVPSQTGAQGAVPKISLTLDEEELKYVPGSEVSFSGSIDVEQGSIAAEDLSLTVNGEKWPMVELMLNGNGYTFSTKGAVPEGTEQLEVRAEIEALDVGSAIRRVTLIAPTAAPGPMFTVELDDSGRDILAIPGKAVTITGAVTIQGDVDPSKLVLYVDDKPCEMTLRQTQPNQYEFSADAAPKQGATEMTVWINLDGTETYSRAQRLYLVAPSPTPAPELYLTLNDTTVVYTEGENAVIRGGIQVSGQVAADDLVLYVNNVKWDMDLEPQGDDTYSFVASNSIAGGDVSQMDVKVRLRSNTSIASNSEKLSVVTPEPSASPAPTRRPEVTPPPTAVPTPSPVAAVETDEPEGGQEDDPAAGWVKDHIALLAALAAATVLVIVVIVVVARKKHNDSDGGGDTIGVGIDTIDEENMGDKRKTVGPFDDGGDPPTEYGETTPGVNEKNTYSDSDFVDDGTGGETIETIDLSEEDTGTVILDEDDPDGTQLLGEDQNEGTIWLEPEVLGLEVVVEQLRGDQTVSSEMYRILSDERLVFGRLKDGTDVQIDDKTVSARHIALGFDGERLSVEDLGSRNGMKVNGETVSAGEKKTLQDGDKIKIGRTTLIFHFGKPELY